MRRRAPRDQVPEGHLPSHVSPLRRRNYRQHSLIHSPSATNGWPRSRRAMAIASAEGPASSRRDRLRTPGDAGITSGNPMAPGACVPAPHRPIHIDHGMRRTVGVPSWADGLLRGISCPARPAIQPGYLTIKPGPLDALSRHLVHRSIPHAHIPIRRPIGLRTGQGRQLQPAAARNPKAQSSPGRAPHAHWRGCACRPPASRSALQHRIHPGRSIRG